MAVVGPGAIVQNDVAPEPLLTGISEYEYVTVHNPLNDDFAVQVAQDIPVNMPMEIRDKTAGVQDRNGLVMNYGQDFKNPDFQSRKHVLNQTIIPAGKSVNFRGNEAMVAVRQLTNELMQREKNSKFLADPHLRRVAEEKIVVKRGYIQELMDTTIQSPQQQALHAIDQSNEVGHVQEQAFPALGQQPESGDSSQTAPAESPAASDSSEPRRVGRPKKTDSQ